MTHRLNPSTAESFGQLRVAIVHYWFVRRRGGERVVEAIANLFPQADLFAVVADANALPESLRERRLKTSFVQSIPGSLRWHRHFVPLYPAALEQFDFSGYDLVFSSESGPAKGILTGTQTCHICYCHSPMRYLWDFYHRYQQGSGFGIFTRLFFRMAAHYLRFWDLASASRVDYFIANSETVASRIRKHYRREAAVIFPPVDTQHAVLSAKTDGYYLVVSHLADYKRVDLAIEACNRLNRPLRIVGDGEQYRRLRKLAGPSIEFLGALSDADVRAQYANCRALLFPGEEDFGIVPVEAMSFGRPVIAYERGGATETVQGVARHRSPESSTGIFFAEQTVASMMNAIQTFESLESRFSPAYIRRHALQFDRSRFDADFLAFVSAKLAEFRSSGAPVSLPPLPDSFDADLSLPSGLDTTEVSAAK